MCFFSSLASWSVSYYSSLYLSLLHSQFVPYVLYSFSLDLFFHLSLFSIALLLWFVWWFVLISQLFDISQQSIFVITSLSICVLNFLYLFTRFVLSSEFIFYSLVDVVSVVVCPLACFSNSSALLFDRIEYEIILLSKGIW